MENSGTNFSSSENTDPPLEQELDTADTLSSKIKRAVLGSPRNLEDPGLFHRISLVAFLAWVGLGADGLSSSAYGPDESMRALGEHTYLALGLAAATAFTVFIISYAYSRIIEHFPFGGGGYVVASKLLGPRIGVISGSALLVDYVLTISVSIASGADQVFSVLPLEWHIFKIPVVVFTILILTVLNLRGVKESVSVLVPIFLIFLVAHIILIIGGIFTHMVDIGNTASRVSEGYSTGLKTLGFVGMGAIFLRAYSMGAGTYTGLEAVSNGIQIMREPKVATARRTMVYMAVSLAITAGGILVCYLLFKVTPEIGKTMNAVLAERFAASWQMGPLPIGKIFIVIVLGSEAALLFVGAQAGFVDGPRVMSNMASDSWLPHRFSSLSDRLTMQNGVLIVSFSAIVILLITRGSTFTLVLMYSINVFLTFSLSQAGMVRYWLKNREKYHDWYRHITIHIIGLVLCVSILMVSLYEKFTSGGWITILVTALLVLFCLRIKKHYDKVRTHLSRLDDILADIPEVDGANLKPIDPKAPTAVLMVNGFGGLGLHSFLTIIRLFPNHYKNFVFISVDVVDAGLLKGMDDLKASIVHTEEDLKKYVTFANAHGFSADYRLSAGTDALEEITKLARDVAAAYPRSIFFSGKLIFEREKWYQRILHNETAFEIQRRLQFAGMNAMVLPVRVFDTQSAGK